MSRTGEWWRVTCPTCGHAEAQLTELAHDGYRGDLSDLTSVDIGARCLQGGHAFTVRILTTPEHRIVIRAIPDEQPASWEQAEQEGGR